MPQWDPAWTRNSNGTAHSTLTNRPDPRTGCRDDRNGGCLMTMMTNDFYERRIELSDAETSERSVCGVSWWFEPQPSSCYLSWKQGTVLGSLRIGR